jgi:hypothetical protein
MVRIRFVRRCRSTRGGCRIILRSRLRLLAECVIMVLFEQSGKWMGLVDFLTGRNSQRRSSIELNLKLDGIKNNCSTSLQQWLQSIRSRPKWSHWQDHHVWHVCVFSGSFIKFLEKGRNTMCDKLFVIYPTKLIKSWTFEYTCPSFRCNSYIE